MFKPFLRALSSFRYWRIFSVYLFLSPVYFRNYLRSKKSQGFFLLSLFNFQGSFALSSGCPSQECLKIIPQLFRFVNTFFQLFYPSFPPSRVFRGPASFCTDFALFCCLYLSTFLRRREWIILQHFGNVNSKFQLFSIFFAEEFLHTFW